MNPSEQPFPSPRRYALAPAGLRSYRIVSRWRLRGRAAEVAPILEDAESCARWWPAAFLRVRRLDRAEPDTMRIHCKGWLPYTLRLDARATACRYPHACTFFVRGDVAGRCDCTLVDDDDGQVTITFDWRVTVRKPLLRWLSLAVRPLLAANHRWAMRQGRRSLEIELERRRGRSVARPPAPTFPYGRSSSLPARAWRACSEALAPRAERRLDDAPW